MKPLRISPSRYLAWQDCGMKYRFRYILKVRKAIEDANLAFGKIIHTVIELYLRALWSGRSLDPVTTFEAQWEEATNSASLAYNASTTPEDLLATGRVLMERFPEAWIKSQLEPVSIDGGEPALEVKSEVRFGDSVIANGIIDIIAVNPRGKVGPIDWKTPAQSNAAEAEFALAAPQMRFYQPLADEVLKRADDPSLRRPSDFRGFVNLVKRKVSKTGRGRGPEVLQPETVPRASRASIDAIRTSTRYMADDIRRGRLLRTERAAYNTPCQLCEFQRLCWVGDRTGLVIPGHTKNEAAPLNKAAA
ncbi:MAG: PD-(D/E)XK nuclease family protein [Verrucomicrobiota bacterium]